MKKHSLLTLLGSCAFIAVLATAAMYALIDSHESGDAHAGTYVAGYPGDTANKRFEKSEEKILKAIEQLREQIRKYHEETIRLRSDVDHMKKGR